MKNLLDTETLADKLKLVILSGVMYFVLFDLNQYIFSHLEHTQYVSWVFLPSGLRLLLVLVLAELGALGIALASLCINFTFIQNDSVISMVVTAVISGLGAYIARFISINLFKLDVDLKGLTSRSLFLVTLLFAFISSSLHQIWFYWSGITEDFITHTFIMFVGDWVGTVLVLATASMLVRYLAKK